MKVYYDKDADLNVIKNLKIGDTSVDPDVRKNAYHLALSRIAEEVFMFPLWFYLPAVTSN